MSATLTTSIPIWARSFESETMAVLARAPDVGRQLLDLAKRWRDLANDTERDMPIA
jgi:hypothetical protein